MNTEKQDMKAFLAGLQQLQRNDEFEHTISVKATKTCDGGLMVEASMFSNVEKNESGRSELFTCYLYECKSKRVNEAEYERFKYLLLSDVAPEPQQK